MIKSAVLLVGMVLMGSAIADVVNQNTTTSKTTIEVSELTTVVSTATVDSDLDELVLESLHEDDRRFSRIG
ncbi:MAG: hypothetical protein WC627_09640 [Legionella sp.]|jgi:hypothetical protein